MKKVKVYDKLHGLCANNNSNCNYLELLDEALRQIERTYFESTGRYNRQKLERVFCYELYFQMKTIMNDKNRCYFKDELMISGEIGKYCKVEDGQLYLVNDSKYDLCYIYPDLVIHKSQRDNSPKYQKLIIEAKFDNYDESPIVKDLTKLLNALNKLQFQCAIFLSINTCMERLVSKIQEFLSEVNLNDEAKNGLFKRLIVVNISRRERGVPLIEAVSLYDILQAR